MARVNCCKTRRMRTRVPVTANTDDNREVGHSRAGKMDHTSIRSIRHKATMKKKSKAPLRMTKSTTRNAVRVPRSHAQSPNSNVTLLILLALQIQLFNHLPTVHSSKVQCTSNEECQPLLLPESECINGYCSNPFQKGGCLKNMMPGWNKLRICNSEDPIDAAELGYCRKQAKGSSSSSSSSSPPGFDYREIRILTQNWESSYFSSWILQILLSELLDVPVTLETGTADAELNFYHPESPFDYGSGNDFTAFDTSMKRKDCKRREEEDDDDGHEENGHTEYVPCAHVCPEVWQVRMRQVREVIETTGSIDAETIGLGVLGQLGWYMPKYTAQFDPTLVSYFGLQANDDTPVVIPSNNNNNNNNVESQEHGVLINVDGNATTAAVTKSTRQKLAELFLRPTKFGEYCEKYSSTSCTADDGIAQRRPIDDEESNKYFIPNGIYRGYFRKTDKNLNCDKNNDDGKETCTGHIADLPCDWLGHMDAQLHHLDIPLESDEPPTRKYRNEDIPSELAVDNKYEYYTYNNLVEMIYAANETKSHIMFQLWQPQQLYERFVGTDAELVRIALPRPTQTCLEARLHPDDRCATTGTSSATSSNGNDPAAIASSMSLRRFGTDPAGACDDAAHDLQKILSPILRDDWEDVTVPNARKSPSYEVIKAFRISNFQLSEIFQYWFERESIDEWNYDPRHATCRWFVENFDYIQQFVPETYPRIIVENGGGSNGVGGGSSDSKHKDSNNTSAFLYYSSLLVGIVALITVVVSMIILYWKRQERVIRHAQIEFLYILLVGMLLSSCAPLVGTSFSSVAQPTNGSCIAYIWLSQVGYDLAIIPIIVKVAAVNQLAQAARKLKRVRLSRRYLFQVQFFLTSLTVIFLTCWSFIDPPQSKAEYDLTDTIDDDGYTVVTVDYFCTYGENNNWRYFAIGWNFVYLIIATVLAFQTRNVVKVFNESQILAFMIYSHFVFAMGHVSLFLLEDSLQPWEVAWIQNLLLSGDIIAMICIYFVPKFLAAHFGTEHDDHRGISGMTYLPRFSLVNMVQRVSVTTNLVFHSLRGTENPNPHAHGNAGGGGTAAAVAAANAVVNSRVAGPVNINNNNNNNNNRRRTSTSISTTMRSRRSIGNHAATAIVSRSSTSGTDPRVTYSSGIDSSCISRDDNNNDEDYDFYDSNDDDDFDSEYVTGDIGRRRRRGIGGVYDVEEEEDDMKNDVEDLTERLLSLDKNQATPTLSGGFQQLLIMLGDDGDNEGNMLAQRNGHSNGDNTARNKNDNNNTANICRNDDDNTTTSNKKSDDNDGDNSEKHYNYDTSNGHGKNNENDEEQNNEKTTLLRPTAEVAGGSEIQNNLYDEKKVTSLSSMPTMDGNSTSSSTNNDDNDHNSNDQINNENNHGDGNDDDYNKNEQTSNKETNAATVILPNKEEEQQQQQNTTQLMGSSSHHPDGSRSFSASVGSESC